MSFFWKTIIFPLIVKIFYLERRYWIYFYKKYLQCSILSDLLKSSWFLHHITVDEKFTLKIRKASFWTCFTVSLCCTVSIIFKMKNVYFLVLRFFWQKYFLSHFSILWALSRLKQTLYAVNTLSQEYKNHNTLQFSESKQISEDASVSSPMVWDSTLPLEYLCMSMTCDYLSNCHARWGKPMSICTLNHRKELLPSYVCVYIYIYTHTNRSSNIFFPHFSGQFCIPCGISTPFWLLLGSSKSTPPYSIHSFNH